MSQHKRKDAPSDEKESESSSKRVKREWVSTSRRLPDDEKEQLRLMSLALVDPDSSMHQLFAKHPLFEPRLPAAIIKQFLVTNFYMQPYEDVKGIFFNEYTGLLELFLHYDDDVYRIESFTADGLRKKDEATIYTRRRCKQHFRNAAGEIYMLTSGCISLFDARGEFQRDLTAPGAITNALVMHYDMASSTIFVLTHRSVIAVSMHDGAQLFRNEYLRPLSMCLMPHLAEVLVLNRFALSTGPAVHHDRMGDGKEVFVSALQYGGDLRDATEIAYDKKRDRVLAYIPDDGYYWTDRHFSTQHRLPFREVYVDDVWSPSMTVCFDPVSGNVFVCDLYQHSGVRVFVNPA